MEIKEAKLLAIEKLIDDKYKNFFTFQCVDDKEIEDHPDDDNFTGFCVFGDPVVLSSSIAHAMLNNEDVKAIMVMALNAYNFMEADSKEKQN